MTPSASFLAHWYYHVPDLIAAALIYLLLARFVLTLIWQSNGANLAVQVLHRVTDPILKTVAAITPRAVPQGLVIVFAVAWLVTVRLALFIAVTARGIRLASG